MDLIKILSIHIESCKIQSESDPLTLLSTCCLLFDWNHLIKIGGADPYLDRNRFSPRNNFYSKNKMEYRRFRFEIKIS
jgi:hypothetical protein